MHRHLGLGWEVRKHSVQIALEVLTPEAICLGTVRGALEIAVTLQSAIWTCRVRGESPKTRRNIGKGTIWGDGSRPTRFSNVSVDTGLGDGLMRRLKIGTAILCLAWYLSGAAVASPQFMQYESRNAVREGQGGERKTVDGVDFWMRGDPPRRYQIVGSLTDERHKTGLFGLIRMSSLESDIAKAAKAAGGDAVILEAEGDDTIGMVGQSFGNTNGTYGNGSFNANGSSFGIARPMQNHESRYIVVKYMTDVPAESAPLSAQTP